MLGSETVLINGQRFVMPTRSQYAPTQYGPQTTGVPQVSPTWWAVAFGLVGLVLLKGIHWRDTTLAGFEERGRAGSAREEASAEA